MLYSKKIISIVAKNLGDYPLIIDPVIIAESGAQLLKEDAIEALKEKAILTTPNLFEAEKLSGIKIKTKEDAKKACREIAKHGCSNNRRLRRKRTSKRRKNNLYSTLEMVT